MISATRLVNANSLSLDEVALAFAEVRHIDPQYAEVAENIIPGSSKFLNNYIMQKFVMFDIADDTIIKEIDRQKSFFRRVGNLLPELSRFLNIKRDTNLHGIFHLISDCFEDYILIEKSGRKDKIKHGIVDSISRNIEITEKLICTMVDLDYNARGCYGLQRSRRPCGGAGR